MADVDCRALLKTGDTLAKAGDIRGANDCYLQAAEAYDVAGFKLKAVALYKQILTLDPTRRELRSKLAAIYDALGLHTDAANVRNGG